MVERWQAFQLGWELFQHLNAQPADTLFDPLVGSILARLRQLNLELDLAAIAQVKTLGAQGIVARIPELKGFLGNQLVALTGTPAMVAFSLGFDLGLTYVVHMNILQGLNEPVEQVRENLEQELDGLDIDPQLLRPLLDRLDDHTLDGNTFAGLVIQAAKELSFPLANPGGRETVFVVMPFDPAFQPTLETIRKAARYAGYYAWRADDRAYAGTSIPDVYLKGIAEAAQVIVDLTGNRPNVYWEAGYALARGKQPLYIAQAGTEVHFDVRGYPVLFFGTQADLEQRLVFFLKSRATAAPKAE